MNYGYVLLSLLTIMFVTYRFSYMANGKISLVADIASVLSKKRIVNGSFQLLMPMIMVLLTFVAIIFYIFLPDVIVFRSSFSLVVPTVLNAFLVFMMLVAFWITDCEISIENGMRYMLQMTASEIAFWLFMLPVVLISGSLDITEISNAQTEGWMIIRQPLGFLGIVPVVMLMNGIRPFSLSGSDSNEFLYLGRYSSIEYLFFRLAERLKLVLYALVMVCVYFGGSDSYGLFADFDGSPLAGFGVISFKAILVIIFLMILNKIMPVLRFKQNMRWLIFVLYPVGLFNVIITLLVFGRLF